MSEEEVTWRDRLRHALRRDRRKQSAIARDAGIHPSTLSRIISGRMEPRYDTMLRLSDTLGVSLGWIGGELHDGLLLAPEEVQMLRELAEFLDKLSRNQPTSE